MEIEIIVTKELIKSFIIIIINLEFKFVIMRALLMVIKIIIMNVVKNLIMKGVQFLIIKLKVWILLSLLIISYYHHFLSF